MALMTPRAILALQPLEFVAQRLGARSVMGVRFMTALFVQIWSLFTSPASEMIESFAGCERARERRVVVPACARLPADGVGLRDRRLCPPVVFTISANSSFLIMSTMVRPGPRATC